MSARRSIIPVFIPHLGCPHDCVFCNQRKISGSLSPASAADVVLAIEAGLPHCETPPELAFYGGSFTAIPESEQLSLLDAARPYLEGGEVASLRLSTRPDAIDEKTLDRLAEYGVGTIELGVQSMCDDVLFASGRGHTASDAERASALIKQRGFGLILQMMTGLPGSSDEKDIGTARRIAALGPDGVRVYPTVIIRDTALYELWRAGKYREHTVEDAVRVCAEILPLLQRAGIPVIRLGLNPTDDLSAGEAAGGAYHPALGEMVKSRILLKKAEALLTDVRGGSVTLGTARSCVSQMTGQHRCNIEALRSRFGLSEVKVAVSDMEPGEVMLLEHRR